MLDKRILKISKEKLDIDKCICIDPYDWNIQCISNDGEPIFEISNEYEKYASPSNSIINLVKYIIRIGIESEVLEKMRLL